MRSRPVQQPQYKGDEQQRDRRPAEPVVIQRDARGPDHKPRQREPDSKAILHRRNWDTASRKSGVPRATALTRAPSSTPSVSDIPSS